MADKQISALPRATSIQTTDLFAVQQANQAKAVTGQVLINELAAKLDGHGGITSIIQTGTSGLNRIYTITFADGSTSPLTVSDGQQGEPGDASYLYIRYAPSATPTSVSTTPDEYIGVCVTTSATAPTNPSSYTWYRWKGSNGDPGTAGSSIAAITKSYSVNNVDVYTITFTDDSTPQTFSVTNGATIQSITKTSSSGLTDIYTITMSDGTTQNITVTNGKSVVSFALVDGNHAPGTNDTYRLTYNDGDTDDIVVYNGANGDGAVSTVAGIPVIGNQGDVPLIKTGSGAPTSATPGYTKQLYYDTTNNVMYICVSTSGGTYDWRSSTVTVDSALSSSSTNPVQNKVVKAALDTKAPVGLGITGASVGQFPKIASVDSNGVPTAYIAGTASGGGTALQYYGECSTAASTAAKTVSISDITELTTGLMIAVKFTFGNTAANPTLQVNSLATKAMYRYGTTVMGNDSDTTGWRAGQVLIFVYDGVGWQNIKGYNTDTVYTAGYGTCSDSGTSKTTSVTGYILSAGAIVAVKFANAVQASSTLNVSSTGAKAIYYQGSAIADSVILAGDTATMMYDGTQYHVLSIDRDETGGGGSGGVMDNWYGSCSTAAGTNAKTVSASGYTLEKGMIVSVRFTNGSTASNPTLNVNSTGAKSIYYQGTVVGTNVIKSGDVVTFIYDGSYYRIIAIDRIGASELNDLSDTNISDPSDGQYLKYDGSSSKWINASGGGSGGADNYYGYNAEANSTVNKTLTVDSGFSLAEGVIVTAVFANGNTAESATLNVNSSGAKTILYQQTTLNGDEITENDAVTFMYDGTYWLLLAISSNGGGGSGATTLSGLSDTTISSPSDGQALVYDSSSFKWVNGNVSGSGTTDTFCGTTTTAASTAVKEVIISGFTKREGTIISINFQYGNTSSYIYLKINNSSTNDQVLYNTNQLPGNYVTIDPYDQVTMIYIGSNLWRILSVSSGAVGGSGGGSGGSTTLDGLSDTVINEPSDGQVLTYDGSLSKWKNVTPSGGGGSGLSQVNWYGTSSTAASTTAKVVTCSGYTLATGEIVAVRFTNANTKASATLNVNSTGAKTIKYKGANTTGSDWAAGDTCTFLYDGTYYQLISVEGSSSGGGTSERTYTKPWYVNTSGNVVECNTIQDAINGCPIHGTVHIPWYGTTYSVSSTIHIMKPITLESDYTGFYPRESIGYTVVNGVPTAASSWSSAGVQIPYSTGADVPLIQSTASTYGIDVHCYGVTLRNISIYCSNQTSENSACLHMKDDFGYDTSNAAQPFMHNTLIENCAFKGRESYAKGVWCEGFGVATFKNCYAYYVKYGFYFSKYSSAQCTSITMECCWAWNFSSIGYTFNECDYCTLISCACDSVNSSVPYGYYFINCRGCSAVGCGCEKITTAVVFDGCNNCSFGGVIYLNDSNAFGVRSFTASKIHLDNLYILTAASNPTYVSMPSGSKVLLTNTNITSVNGSSVSNGGMHDYVSV